MKAIRLIIYSALSLVFMIGIESCSDLERNNPVDPEFDRSSSTPTNLILTRLDVTSISIEWEDNSSWEEGFVIERKVGSGSYETLVTKSTNATSHTDNGLTGKRGL